MVLRITKNKLFHCFAEKLSYIIYILQGCIIFSLALYYTWLRLKKIVIAGISSSNKETSSFNVIKLAVASRVKLKRYFQQLCSNLVMSPIHTTGIDITIIYLSANVTQIAVNNLLFIQEWKIGSKMLIVISSNTLLTQ